VTAIREAQWGWDKGELVDRGLIFVRAPTERSQCVPMRTYAGLCVPMRAYAGLCGPIHWVAPSQPTAPVQRRLNGWLTSIARTAIGVGLFRDDTPAGELACDLMGKERTTSYAFMGH